MSFASVVLPAPDSPVNQIVKPYSLIFLREEDIRPLTKPVILQTHEYTRRMAILKGWLGIGYTLSGGAKTVETVPEPEPEPPLCHRATRLKPGVNETALEGK